MELHKKLIHLRKEHGLTQKQVAEILEMSVTGYGFYEQGIRVIPMKKLNRLADYYGVPLEYFISENAKTIFDVKEEIRSGLILGPDGEPLEDTDRQAVVNFIEVYFDKERGSGPN